MSQSTRLRTIWWTVHRWIAIGLALLLVPIGISGALLVWRDHFDALIHPSRYAVTGSALIAPSAYIASAGAALGTGVQPTALRFPDSEGWPVVVMARGAPRGEGGPPRLVNVYIDPPTARVLEAVDFRSSLVGWLHRFHENLTIPEYFGRAIVGWVGVGMLILSLTGIWLWWPRSSDFITGLRWHRAPFVTTNLHHLLGFWISIPLAAVSITGIYLGFPQTARQVMSSITAMTPQSQRPGFAAITGDARLTPEAALSAALATRPGAQPIALFLPTLAATTPPRGRGRGGGERADSASQGDAVWRVQMAETDRGGFSTVLVDDRSGAVERLSDPTAGDRAAQWIRWIHEGNHLSPLWSFIVFLTGIFPSVFVATGMTMWWRGRRNRSLVSALVGEGELQAAE
jgi:uncharacterized iron-regulated membrane protein